jgi:predicted metal-dependent hydrolase
MFALKHCGYELGDVEEFIRGVELEIHEGLQDVWRQVLERKKGEA